MDEPASPNLVARPIGCALAALFAAALLLAGGTCAWASDPFPVREDFRGAAFGTQWRRGGSAELTGGKEAEGWLRLTAAEGGEFGYAYDDEASRRPTARWSNSNTPTGVAAVRTG